MHNRPFLKWAGNKYRCLNTILQHFPQGKRLIEPFTGSGAVFLNTDYDSYILAERNPDLVNLFNFLREDGKAFIDYCRQFFTPQNNSKETYCAFRETFNQSDIGHKRAALFLYLNRHAYNGLCRYNKSSLFNVPFGSYRKPYFPEKELLHFYHKSQHATIITNDFRSTFELARAGDIIYCDPPYVPLSKSAYFTSYTDQKFSEEDQLALADLAKEHAARGITVLISNHDTPFTREHYENSELISFSVSRQISCKAELRQPVPEILAIFRG